LASLSPNENGTAGFDCFFRSSKKGVEMLEQRRLMLGFVADAKVRIAVEPALKFYPRFVLTPNLS